MDEKDQKSKWWKTLNVSRFPATATGTRILKGMEMKDGGFQAAVMLSLYAIIILLFIIAFGGCMIAEGEKTTYLPTGEVISHVKVKMTQCMTDSARTNFTVDIKDLGKVSLGSSVMDAEEFKAIVTELKPFFIALLGL